MSIQTITELSEADSKEALYVESDIDSQPND